MNITTNLTASQLVGNRANSLTFKGDVNLLMWFLSLIESIYFLCVSWSSQLTAVVLRTLGNVGICLDGCMGVCFIVFLVSWRLLQEDKKQISFKEISLPWIVWAITHTLLLLLQTFCWPHFYLFTFIISVNSSHRKTPRGRITCLRLAVRKWKLTFFNLNLSGSGIPCFSSVVLTGLCLC